MTHLEQNLDQFLINDQVLTPESSPLNTTKVNLFFDEQNYVFIESRMDEDCEVASAENQEILEIGGLEPCLGIAISDLQTNKVAGLHVATPDIINNLRSLLEALKPTDYSQLRIITAGQVLESEDSISLKKNDLISAISVYSMTQKQLYLFDATNNSDFSNLENMSLMINPETQRVYVFGSQDEYQEKLLVSVALHI